MQETPQSTETDQPAPVSQFFGLELFEHYQEDGYLLVATSDATALRLEPGDFIVKRLWSTAVAPYVYNRARSIATPPARCTSCGDTGRTPWMSESDPNCYQEPDADGMVPCIDCSPGQHPADHTPRAEQGGES